VKSLFKRVCVVAGVSALTAGVVGLLMSAVSTTVRADFVRYNPPPCDFNDDFYTANGINVTQLDTAAAGRFGLFRLTGPPAGSGQVNWVTDTSCSGNDPTRNNTRILETTGSYKDDDGAPTEFISIIAFLLDSTFFTGTANARGFTMQSIVSNFEAYGAPKQRNPSTGVIAPSPCGTMGDGLRPCFPVTSVATPNLRQDWRVSSNRNAIDGSSNGPATPFGYFCDDTLGMWIVTYFWYTKYAVGGRPDQPHPTANCNKVLAAFAADNGTTLDGTPIIHTGDELHFIEGVVGAPPPAGLTSEDLPPLSAPCGAEGNLDVGGADGGAVWLICPTILDPRNGAIAPDAFLDTVRTPTGLPLDPRFNRNFNCLQQKGEFPSPTNGC
jgi:hypothetical protein